MWSLDDNGQFFFLTLEYDYICNISPSEVLSCAFSQRICITLSFIVTQGPLLVTENDNKDQIQGQTLDHFLF